MNLIKRIYRSINHRVQVFKSTPDYVRERWLMGIKRILKPTINLPIWVTTKRGAKIFVGKDIIDEYILDDLCSTMEDRYFPPNLLLKSGDIVIDAGGHHGLFAVELLARFPGIRILSIEPDPEGIRIIQKHIHKNKASSNIRVIPYAIGPEEKDGFLTDNRDGSWGKTLEGEKKSNSVKVAVKTLHSILDNEAEKIKFIKSNCEGGEFDLVPQLIKLNIKPDLIILMIHPNRGNAKLLIQQIIDYGYGARLIWDSETNPCWHFSLKNNPNID